MNRPHYRTALATIHDQAFGSHADLCAPGMLEILQPVRERSGLVLELGCGSGRLTRHLLDAGHKVIATDASPAMLKIATSTVPKADLRQLVLPDAVMPEADAIVAVGHVFNYLASKEEIDRALLAAATALRPGGILALDICVLEYGRVRAEPETHSRVTGTWALVTRTSAPAPGRFVREMTTFIADDDGIWRRDDERHDNVLIDVSNLHDLFDAERYEVSVREAFGREILPAGMKVLVVGRLS